MCGLVGIYIKKKFMNSVIFITGMPYKVPQFLKIK